MDFPSNKKNYRLIGTALCADGNREQLYLQGPRLCPTTGNSATGW